MGLETGTFISDLVPTNPLVTDQEAQGANHLQLIKSVLQNTFPVTGRAFPFPSNPAVSTSTAITKAQFNATFLVTTTGGAVNMTLPSLVSGDAGWECSIIKATTDANPVFILPPSGTIQSGEYSGLAQARRCIPGARSRVLWTGSAFIAERVPRVPVGTVLEFQGSTLPVGYEWPNGQTLASAATNYPEYSAVNGSGVTPDRRGRLAAALDNLGGAAAANRITNAGSSIPGTTLNGAGGQQNRGIAQANLPAVNFNVSGIGLNDPTHSHSYNTILGGGAGVPGGTGASPQGQTTGSSGTGIFLTDYGGGVQAFASSGGSGTALVVMPPTIMMNFILVTE